MPPLSLPLSARGCVCGCVYRCGCVSLALGKCVERRGQRSEKALQKHRSLMNFPRVVSFCPFSFFPLKKGCFFFLSEQNWLCAPHSAKFPLPPSSNMSSACGWTSPMMKKAKFCFFCFLHFCSKIVLKQTVENFVQHQTCNTASVLTGVYNWTFCRRRLQTEG